jgi:hypothetical protein
MMQVLGQPSTEDNYLKEKREMLEYLAGDASRAEVYVSYAGLQDQDLAEKQLFPQGFRYLGESRKEKENNVRIIRMLQHMDVTRQQYEKLQRQQYESLAEAHDELHNSFCQRRVLLHNVFNSPFFRADPNDKNYHASITADEFILEIRKKCLTKGFQLDENLENNLRQLYGDERQDGLVTFKDNKYPHTSFKDKEEVDYISEAFMTDIVILTDQLKLEAGSHVVGNLVRASKEYLKDVEMFDELAFSTRALEQKREKYLLHREKIISGLIQPVVQLAVDEEWHEAEVITEQADNVRTLPRSGLRKFARTMKYAAVFVVAMTANLWSGGKPDTKMPASKVAKTTIVQQAPVDTMQQTMVADTAFYTDALAKIPTHKIIRPVTPEPEEIAVASTVEIFTSNMAKDSVKTDTIKMTVPVAKPDSTVAPDNVHKMFQNNKTATDTVSTTHAIGNFKYILK